MSTLSASGACVRTLALDVGDKRIGLAISDPMGTFAQPLMTIERKGDVASTIAQIVIEREVGKVVIGLPINMDGSRGERVEKVEEFTKELRNKTSVPLVYMDERLTTSEAERLMISADIGRKKRRKSIDSIAAAIILEKWLRSGGGQSFPRADDEK